MELKEVLILILAIRLGAIASRLEAIAVRVEAIAIRLEEVLMLIVDKFSKPSFRMPQSWNMDQGVVALTTHENHTGPYCNIIHP